MKLCSASIFASAALTKARSAEEGMPCASGLLRGRVAGGSSTADAAGKPASRASASSLGIMKRLVAQADLVAVPLDPVVPLLDARAVLEALELSDQVEGDVVVDLDAEVAAVAEPARGPEEVVGRVGGHRGILVDARERVLAAEPRRSRRAEHGGQPEPAPVLPGGLAGGARGLAGPEVPAQVGHELQWYAAVAPVARDRVEHVVVLENHAVEAAVLAADARLQFLDAGELEERSPQLDASVRARAEEARARGEQQPHAAVVEDVAAARGQEREAQARAGALVVRLQREGASLRPQVAVPQHLGQRHRHLEATALQARAAAHLPAREREVDAGVAGAVVVADDRLGGQVVLVAAPVELAADAQRHLVDADLHAGQHAQPPAVLVAEAAGDVEDSRRPLLPPQAVELELEAVLLLGREQ